MPAPTATLDATESGRAHRREYCDALLYVCGHGRRARDWLVGFACALPGDNAVIVTHLLSSTGAAHHLDDFIESVAKRTAQGDLTEAEAITVRSCFLFDCCTVCALTCHPEERTAVRARVEEARRLTSLPEERVARMLELAEAEKSVTVEKFQVLQD